MDTVTQAVLGAAVGQGGFARKLGRKANWWGAFGGLVPDFDVFMGVFVGEWGELVWHRGPTHALWFGPIAGPLLGWLTWRYYRRKARRRERPGRQAPPDVGVGPQTADAIAPDPAADGALPAWMGLWTLALLTHPLLDTFTTYGTQLLAPFDRTRFALDGVSIIDPLYTGVLGLALLIGWASRRRPRRAMLSAQLGLLLTTGYLGYGYLQNETARDLAIAQATERDASLERMDAYPTFFQPWGRRVVAWYPDRVEVGAISTLDPRPIQWTVVTRTEGPAVDAVRNHPNGQLFDWFASGRLVAFTEPVEGGTRVDLEDFRLAFPDRPGHALWGIRAVVAPDGTLIDGPHRFRHARPDDLEPALRAVWDGAFPP